MPTALRNKRLTRQITVPVSAGLQADADAYFEARGTSGTSGTADDRTVT